MIRLTFRLPLHSAGSKRLRLRGSEGNIQASVKLIIDPPMLANCATHSPSIRQQTADAEPPFLCNLALDGALRLDNAETLKIKPVRQVRQISHA